MPSTNPTNSEFLAERTKQDAANAATAARLTALEARVTALEQTPVPVPPPAGNELWHDNIQNATTVEQSGFDWYEVEWPIGTDLVKPWGPDSRGANLSLVADPLNPARKCLRMLARVGVQGGRSQFGWLGANNAAFNDQAKAGIYIAYEVFHPAAFAAGGNPGSWLSGMDFHAISTSRLSTSPGLMYNQDGSMRFRYEWGGTLNPVSPWSSAGYRTGVWETVEQFYRHSTARDVTVRTWLNRELVLEQSGVQTANAPGGVEGYIKLYGQSGAALWAPDPAIRLVCNVRWGAARLT